MTTWLRRLCRNTTRQTKRREAARARPQVEGLEDRRLMTVTYHGGALLRNVEVESMYYGRDWGSSPYYDQMRYLNGFLGNVVNSSYMDMLNKAGYGVGRGSATPGRILSATIDKTQYLSDKQIQGALLNYIDSGAGVFPQAPDANRLYVVFVEPNVVVGSSSSNSVNNFLGYHGSFHGWTWSQFTGWTYNTIRYAVIAYPRGTVGNAGLWWLSDLNSMTVTASHELAEAVTDPDPASGWNDDAKPYGEVGDLANAQTVFLNGYAVQRIADQNDQPMTPAGAASINPVNFVLRKDGGLYMSSGSGLTSLVGGIASISDQGIDNYGHAMIDVVTTGGDAWEYHEGGGWTPLLAGGVKSAKAGQGVSYVLSNNGTVYEYKDWVGHLSPVLSNVTAIDAGTDRYGVNMVAGVYGGWLGFEYSDSWGWHPVFSGARAVSAGQQGNLVILSTGGSAWHYSEATGSSVLLRTNVAAVAAGTDQYGNPLIELLGTDLNLFEYGVGDRLTRIFGGVVAAGKPHRGTVDVVFYWGDAYSYDSYSAYGAHLLSSNAVAAA
jgi:hypothetical protein